MSPEDFEPLVLHVYREVSASLRKNTPAGLKSEVVRVTVSTTRRKGRFGFDLSPIQTTFEVQL